MRILLALHTVLSFSANYEQQVIYTPKYIVFPVKKYEIALFCKKKDDSKQTKTRSFVIKGHS